MAYITPEHFGAVGDGVTNDSLAFEALSAYLEANDGGGVRLRPRATYLVGRQAEGATSPEGHLFYLYGTTPLRVENVSTLIIHGNRAKMKSAAGMKFGTFDPGTGAVHNPSLPFVDFSYRAEPGFMIYTKNVDFVRVYNVVFDGNAANLVIGGEWGDTGRQVVHTSIQAETCGDVLWEGLLSYDFALDNFIYAQTGATEAHPVRPFVMRNCTGLRAGRNNMSLVGGKGTILENVELNGAGEVYNDAFGLISTAPKSCLDVEAESAVIRDATLRKCRLIGGAESFASFIADSGDTRGVLLDDCLLVGGIWANKPGIIFRDCHGHGKFLRLCGGIWPPAVIPACITSSP